MKTIRRERTTFYLFSTIPPSDNAICLKVYRAKTICVNEIRERDQLFFYNSPNKLILGVHIL